MPELMDLEFDDLELFEDEKGEDKGLPVTEEQMQCVKVSQIPFHSYRSTKQFLQ